MGHLILHDLDDDLLDRLKSRAAAHGRTPEEEHRAILKDALRDGASPTDRWQRVAAWRERLKGRSFPDTTQMIREDRDRGAGDAT